MATYDTPSTNYLIPRLDGSSDVADVDEGIAAAVDRVDAVMAGRGSGTLAGLPAPGPGTAPDGFMYRTTDTGQVFLSTGSAWLEIGVSPWMPGDLKLTWLTSAPAGWIVCDGAAVSRSTYAALFTAIGTSAGAGNGSTTFNVPDFRGRAFVMPDGSAGRLASSDTRGASGGAERVTLTTPEIPAHVHPGSGGAFGMTANTPQLAFGTDAAAINAVSADTGSAGGGGSHENMPPFLVGGAVLIKT